MMVMMMMMMVMMRMLMMMMMMIFTGNDSAVPHPPSHCSIGLTDLPQLRHLLCHQVSNFPRV